MSFLWLDKSSTAEIDMLQVFWVSASILFFLRGLEVIEEGKLKVEDRWAGPDVPKIEYRRIGFTFRAREVFPVINAQDSAGAKRKRPTLDPPSSLWLWWLAALVCVAGGVLTKWTGAAFFYGTVIPLLWWRGQLRLLWRRHHLICAAVAAGIVLAWVGAAATMAGWHDLYGTVSREGLMRLSPSHHHRPYPWGESLGHPIRLLAASLPCSAFALLSFRPGFSANWDDRGLRLLQAMHCWTWPNMLFWTVIPEHATRHSFPLFPGLAGLAALVWISWLRGFSRTRSQALPGNGMFTRLFLALIPLRQSLLEVRSQAEPGNEVRRISVARLFIGLVVVWMVVKLVFAEAILPRRNPARQPKEKGEQLAALVPKGNMLYLFQVKDEGIMFYYGRPVRRLTDPDQLPSSNRPIYCILDEAEWRSWKPERPAEMLLRMPDEQGDPIILVRVDRTGKLEAGN